MQFIWKESEKKKSDRCLKVIYHTKLFDWRWWFKKWEVWKRATAFLELSLKIWKMKTPRRLGALKNGSKREWSPVTKEMALKKDVFNYKKVHKQQQRLTPPWLTFYTVPLLTFRFFLLSKNFQFSFVIVDALVFKDGVAVSRRNSHLLRVVCAFVCWLSVHSEYSIMKWHSQIDLRTQEIKNWDIWDHKTNSDD